MQFSNFFKKKSRRNSILSRGIPYRISRCNGTTNRPNVCYTSPAMSHRDNTLVPLQVLERERRIYEDRSHKVLQILKKKDARIRQLQHQILQANADLPNTNTNAERALRSHIADQAEQIEVLVAEIAQLRQHSASSSLQIPRHSTQIPQNDHHLQKHSSTGSITSLGEVGGGEDGREKEKAVEKLDREKDDDDGHLDEGGEESNSAKDASLHAERSLDSKDIQVESNWTDSRERREKVHARPAVIGEIGNENDGASAVSISDTSKRSQRDQSSLESARIDSSSPLYSSSAGIGGGVKAASANDENRLNSSFATTEASNEKLRARVTELEESKRVLSARVVELEDLEVKARSTLLELERQNEDLQNQLVFRTADPKNVEISPRKTIHSKENEPWQSQVKSASLSRREIQKVDGKNGGEIQEMPALKCRSETVLELEKIIVQQSQELVRLRRSVIEKSRKERKSQAAHQQVVAHLETKINELEGELVRNSDKGSIQRKHMESTIRVLSGEWRSILALNISYNPSTM